jgi:hypothetical protein
VSGARRAATTRRSADRRNQHRLRSARALLRKGHGMFRRHPTKATVVQLAVEWAGLLDALRPFDHVMSSIPPTSTASGAKASICARTPPNRRSVRSRSREVRISNFATEAVLAIQTVLHEALVGLHSVDTDTDRVRGRIAMWYTPVAFLRSWSCAPRSYGQFLKRRWRWVGTRTAGTGWFC